MAVLTDSSLWSAETFRDAAGSSSLCSPDNPNTWVSSMNEPPCGALSITVTFPCPKLEAELLLESFLVIILEAFRLRLINDCVVLARGAENPSPGSLGKVIAGVEDSFGLPNDTAGACPTASGDFLLTRLSMTEAHAPVTDNAGVETARVVHRAAVGLVI